MQGVLILQILVYGFTLWFGLYLVTRDLQKPGLRYAGLGLATYAVGLAVIAITATIPSLAEEVARWRFIPVLLPCLFWMIATWHLLPDSNPVLRISGGSGSTLILIFLLLLVAGAFYPLLAQIIVMIIPAAFLIVSLIKIRQAFRSVLPRQPLITLLTATLFFMLGTSLLILPIDWISSEVVLLAISFDFVLLGAALGYLDAYDEGTNFLPDALRSLLAAGVAAVIFGGQVALIMLILRNNSAALILLLFMVIATAILLEVFSPRLQSALDQIIFAGRPHLYHERSLLRSVNAALPRANDRFDPRYLDEAEFARLTRKAISHYSDLDKLAASPLTQLPVIAFRLRQQDKADSQLERAHTLKAVLTESILRLKPYSDKDFDSSDEWRYYNSLYFLYIIGLKPYSVRFYSEALDESTQAALDWFQNQVPERTLYNWQTAAARLVAQHLLEMNRDIAENARQRS